MSGMGVRRVPSRTPPLTRRASAWACRSMSASTVARTATSAPVAVAPKTRAAMTAATSVSRVLIDRGRIRMGPPVGSITECHVTGA
ncbi:hypothetical protein BJF79_07925 [Actinomadura sp. CNU-125]|nr:hypothetical protein BJF79_07925 [Actinomadura sp. CNU-125]